MAIVSLTEEQYEKTRKFIQEQRGKFMAAYYFFLAASVLLIPLAVAELCFGINPVRKSGRRYSATGFCLGTVVMFVALLFKGLGRIFGPGSDYDRIRRSDYSCCHIAVGEKKPNDKNKHPFHITDRNGCEYICVSFLDYKFAEPGCEMIGITLGNGKRYAIQCYDAADPYARME